MDRGIVEFLLLKGKDGMAGIVLIIPLPFVSFFLFHFFFFAPSISINRGTFRYFSRRFFLSKLLSDSNEFYFIAISGGTLLGTTFKNIPASVIVVRVLIERNTMRYIPSNAIAL